MDLLGGEAMKTTPTDIDRKAARLFTPAPGMRVWQTAEARTIGPRRVIEVDENDIKTEGGWSRLPICAIDTDDPATVGCMLAQVEDVAGYPVDAWSHSRHAGTEFEIDRYDGATLGSGPTRGAALVEAMRAMKTAN